MINKYRLYQKNIKFSQLLNLNDFILLIPILLIALFLRIDGMDWDQGFLFHPDERALLMHTYDIHFPNFTNIFLLLDPNNSPMNPHWFPYGGLPIYLLKISGNILTLGSDPSLVALSKIGRSISVIADIGTIFFSFLIARKWHNRMTGFLTAIFISTCILHIQLSHFFAVDTLLTFFTTSSLWFMIQHAKNYKFYNGTISAILVGFAISTKISAMPILFPIIIANYIHTTNKVNNINSVNQAAAYVKSLTILLFIIGTTFFVTSPYAILDFNNFFGDIKEQSLMARGILDYPYTRQYANTTPYIYQLTQHIKTSMFPPLGILCWIGFGLIGVLNWKKNSTNIILMSWILPFLLITGSFQVKFLRYLLPVTPILILYGAQFLVLILEWSKSKIKFSTITSISLGLIIIFTTYYAFAFNSIYSNPHSATSSSEWLQENAPPNSIILKEHWEEGLPNLNNFQIRELPMYEDDNEIKFKSITHNLSEANYLVFFSHRLYGTIPRLSNRYPLSEEFYNLLFSEKLGYNLVHYSKSYPSGLGVTFRDDTFSRINVPLPNLLRQSSGKDFSINMGFLDESFTVYDHPLVLIYENKKKYTEKKLFEIITNSTAQEQNIFSDRSQVANKNYSNSPDMSNIVNLDNSSTVKNLLIWLGVLYLIFFTISPISFLLFQQIPDKGYGLSKILGILILSYLTWILSSIQILPHSRITIMLCLVLLSTCSLAIFIFIKYEILKFIKINWKLIAFYEGIFLLSFMCFLIIRSMNPDLWHPFRGGEKPMDLAYMNAIVRSIFMPPYDPWFAGKDMEYYYFGHFITGTIVKLTRILPTTAYNFAIPTFFALSGTALFSIGYNLAKLSEKHIYAPLKQSSGPVISGILTLFFGLIIGNFHSLFQLSKMGLSIIKQVPLSKFDYWAPSRMMPPDPPGFEITEFPFFTFLFGDLHAHLMAIPLTILAIGIALNIFISQKTAIRDKHIYISILFLALTLGALRITNAWDSPTYFILGLIAIIANQYLTRNKSDHTWIKQAIIFSILLASLTLVIWFPYSTDSTTNQLNFKLTSSHTSILQFLSINGLFLYSCIIFLLSIIIKSIVPELISVLKINKFYYLLLIPLFTFPITVAFFGYGLISILSTISLFIVLVITHLLGNPGQKKNKTTDNNSGTVIHIVIFPLILILLAFALAIAVDIVVLKTDIGRMNTVFKYYMQIWILLSIGSGYAIWYTVFSNNNLGKLSSYKKIWLFGFCILFLSSLIYPISGTNARISDRFTNLPLSLDGTNYMTKAVYEDINGPISLINDLKAIKWILKNINGTPIILEGHTPNYRWGGRISIYTGLPTVIGWDWHQRQQRCGTLECIEVTNRISDVNLIYSTKNTDQALRLIEKYQIELIYIGELERIYYPELGLAKFKSLQKIGAFTELYNNYPVIIYKATNKQNN